MKDLLTPKEVQKRLKVSLALVYRMVERGQLPCIRWESPLGEGKERKKTVLRFEPDAIDKFIIEHRQNGQ